MGRRLGPAARETKIIQKHGTETWDKAADMLRKNGTWAVFAGRVIPVVRIFLPPVAGAACQTAISILLGIGVFAGVKSADSRVLIAAGLLLTLTAPTPPSARIRTAAAPPTPPGREWRHPDQWRG
ncbi:DedA family protein [Streptomyces aurantiacus]|uniref:DedA family protein n=1 Tax=Streptomyces aurantiacus TaxID=47760 RepID=UPI0035204DB3